ncbi:MAG: zf-HC2 domain-containing protein [Candidatus Latescibacteria bacterium]|nr:zf-HC2 domain-containing protein [Candidatus Latescibacterota bacterium]
MKVRRSSTFCELVAESFSAYLDRSLPASVEQEIAAHLDQCPECLQRLEEMKTLIADLYGLGGIEAAPELAWSVKRAVRRLAQRQADAPVLRPIPFLASAAAAAVVLVLVSVGSGPEDASLDQHAAGSSEMQVTQNPRWERYVLPAQVGEENVPSLFDQQAAAGDTSTIREPSRIRGARAVRF